MTYSLRSSARPRREWSTAKRRKRAMRAEREKRRCARILSSCSRTAEWMTAGWVDCDTLYRTLSGFFGVSGKGHWTRSRGDAEEDAEHTNDLRSPRLPPRL